MATSNGSNVTVSQVVVNTVTNHAEKPEKFSGLHFRRWQEKMLCYLTTMNLTRFLTESTPQLAEGETNAQALSAIDVWKHSEFLCRNFVLDGLVDRLYDMFCSIKTAKELWESLDRKYKIEHAGTKILPVARLLEYKMVDFETLISQVQELQDIFHDIHAEGMTLCETFQVAAMIEKLPPSWLDYKNYLKFKRKEMTVDELVVRLCIEEDNRIAQKGTLFSALSKVNIAKFGQTSQDNKSKGNDKGKMNVGHLGPRKRAMKKKSPPFQDNCYICNETGHPAYQCKAPKREVSRRNPNQ